MLPIRDNQTPFEKARSKLEARCNTPLSQALYKLAEDEYNLANNANVRDILRKLSTTSQIIEISSLIQDTNTSI